MVSPTQLAKLAAALSARKSTSKDLKGVFDKFPLDKRHTDAKTPWQYGRRVQVGSTKRRGHSGPSDDSADKAQSAAEE